MESPKSSVKTNRKINLFPLNNPMFFKRFISFLTALMIAMPFALAISTPVAAQQTTAEQKAIEEKKAKEKKAADKKQAAADRLAAEARVDAEMVLMSDVVEALSKNLGQLHYLRKLCFGQDNQFWRDFAGRMINVEADRNVARREVLTRAFNAGYYQEKERFTVCTKNVSADAAAIAENGRRLSTMLGDPYRTN